MASIITDELLKAVAKDFGRAAKHGDIGTGSEPLETSTELELAQYRKITTYFTDVNTCIVQIFLDETEANDQVYTNAGIVYGGTDALGTGKLLAGSDVVIDKSPYENTTISFELTFTRGV